MNYIKAKARDFYLLTTEVENLFINEYMSDAPGDYVKVYLFALLYAQHRTELSHQLLAKQLRIEESTLSMAWDYWERLGVVKKLPNNERGLLNYDIEFIDLRERLYGNAPCEEEVRISKPLENEELKELYREIERMTGQLLTSGDMKEIAYWATELMASAELIKCAVMYCLDMGKKNINYVSKVVEDWNERGFRTREECEEYITQHLERAERYRTILKNLGQFRAPTEGEKKIMRVWFDEWNFRMDRVLEACDKTAGTSTPSIKYVNKVLEGWYNEANAEGRDVNQRFKVSQATLNKYYEYLREKEEKEAKERKAELYSTLPQAKAIDNKIRELSSDISKSLFTGRDQKEVNMLREEMQELEKERAILLTENNFRINHTEVRYQCEACKDTGITDDGQRCSCADQRMKEAEIWQERKEKFK